MKKFAQRLFGTSVAMLPRDFRRAHGAEMQDVFADRLSEVSALRVAPFTLAEIADLAACALRIRVEEARHPSIAAAALFIIAITATTMAFGDLFLARTGAPRIDVSAQDPAGKFTVTIVDGHATGATIDHVAVPVERIVHRGDSIRILSGSGHVALALAYDHRSQQIRWDPRPASCRSNPAECALDQ